MLKSFLCTADEIRAAVDAGKTVYSGSDAYVVVKDSTQRYLIKCMINNYCIGLTWKDRKTLNGIDFYIYT